MNLVVAAHASHRDSLVLTGALLTDCDVVTLTGQAHFDEPSPHVCFPTLLSITCLKPVIKNTAG
jgi:hypothetical protein